MSTPAPHVDPLISKYSSFGATASNASRRAGLSSVPELMMSVLDPPENETFDVSHLRDRVTIMLLFEQIVTLDQIRAVWPLWRAMEEAQATLPLWRLLPIHAGVDSDEVFDLAARVYSFERVDIPSSYNVLHFVKEHRAEFTPDQWERMYELSVLPVAIEYPTRSTEQWIFASYDPGHPSLAAFLDGLGVSYRVRFAPVAVMEEALDTVFPHHESADAVLGPADVFGWSVSHADRAQSAPKRAVTPKTLLNMMERILVDCVREGIRRVCVIPNVDRETELHISRDDGNEHWRTRDDIPPRQFLTFVRRRIIDTHRDDASEAPEATIHRWIDGTRVSFQIRHLPVRDPSNSINTSFVSIEMLP